MFETFLLDWFLWFYGFIYIRRPKFITKTEKTIKNYNKKEKKTRTKNELK